MNNFFRGADVGGAALTVLPRVGRRAAPFGDAARALAAAAPAGRENPESRKTKEERRDDDHPKEDQRTHFHVPAGAAAANARARQRKLPPAAVALRGFV